MKKQDEDKLLIEIHLSIDTHEVVFIGESPISLREYPEQRLQSVDGVYIYDEGEKKMMEITCTFTNENTTKVVGDISRVPNPMQATIGETCYIRKPYFIDDEIRRAVSDSVKEAKQQGHDFSDLDRSAVSQSPYK